MENAAATRDIDLGSDHRVVRALCSFQLPETRKRKRRKSKKGWMPTLDSDKTTTKYHSEIDSNIGALQNAPGMRELRDI